MRRCILLFIITCSACTTANDSMPTLYLSNMSMDKFDQAKFNVFINHKLTISETIQNRYLSFHWTERNIQLPRDSFTLKVNIVGRDFSVEKDTFLLRKHHESQLFVKFSFMQHYKRYDNPEIYKRLPPETSRLREIADSLYENNLLPNATEYLNDTIPYPQSIEISFQ